MIMTEKASAPERLPKILILENHDMHFACVQWRKSGFDEVLKKI